MNEKIYNDFTTQLLPKIQEGLVITKDYFLDLFGRYIKYLLVSDSIALILCLLILVIVSIIFWRIREAIIEYTDGGAFVLLLFLIPVLIGVFINTSNLIKDIYIPEVRVYQELKNYTK